MLRSRPLIGQVNGVQSEIQSQSRIQIDRAQNLKEKCAQSHDNIMKLSNLRNKITEEIEMTLEDHRGQQMV